MFSDLSERKKWAIAFVVALVYLMFANPWAFKLVEKVFGMEYGWLSVLVNSVVVFFVFRGLLLIPGEKDYE